MCFQQLIFQIVEMELWNIPLNFNYDIQRIAIIPARSGSQRLIDKNIMDFNGEPLLVRKINILRKSQLFDIIWVSTDSQKYANLAINSGAHCPILRDQANDNNTPVGVASAYALKQAMQFFKKEFQFVYQFMPNCPLIREKTILNFIESFENKNYKSAISGFDYGWANPYWAVKIDNDNEPKPLFIDALKQRSQDLVKLLCPTGAIWAAKANSLIEANNFYMKDWKMLEIPRYDAADIDDIDDFNFAQVISLD